MSAAGGARRRVEASDVAREGRTDANRAGIVRGSADRAGRTRPRPRPRRRGPRRGRRGDGGAQARTDLRHRVKLSALSSAGAVSAASPAYATDERETDRAARDHALSAADRAYRSRSRRPRATARAARPGGPRRGAPSEAGGRRGAGALTRAPAKGQRKAAA